MKILIIDDQVAPRESIRMILKDKYAIAMAAEATEAFKYMAENPVDLVLLDIRMPKIDGITALKEIKRKHPETEIILLTAYATHETTQKALKSGVFGCLIKPFDKDELLDIIDRALKKRHSNKTL
ncbi:MAG: response regulator [Thermodesulfovibrionia bacterium]|nr:response regulator [Thermodesulfovibrionia bacterium]